MSFWEGLGGVGNVVDNLADKYLKYEKAKADAGLAAALAEQNQLINRPDSITQRPNSMPSNPTGAVVTAGSGQGSGSSLVIGGVEINKTALYVAGAALGVALIIKAVT